MSGDLRRRAGRLPAAGSGLDAGPGQPGVERLPRALTTALGLGVGDFLATRQRLLTGLGDETRAERGARGLGQLANVVLGVGDVGADPTAGGHVGAVDRDRDEPVVGIT